MALLTDTDNTCLPEVGPALILEWALGPLEVSQKSSNGPAGAIFCFERPASGRKHSTKMREVHFETKNAFCNVYFSQGKRQIRENTCFEQHAFFVDSLGVKNVFVGPHFHVFSTLKEEPKP